MPSFAEADRLLGEIQKGMIEGPTELRKVEARAFLQRVIDATPKDTGQAASNWLVGLQQPDARFVEATDPGGARSQGFAVIERAGPETDIFISNAAPYIGRLNDGSSTQAPTMFVEEASREAAFVADIRAGRVLTDALPRC